MMHSKRKKADDRLALAIEAHTHPADNPALPLAQQAATLLEDALGPGTAAALDALSSTAQQLEESNRRVLAWPFLERALAIALVLHGERSPTTSLLAERLAENQISLGDATRAYALFEVVLAHVVGRNGVANAEVADHVFRLASLAYRVGDWRTADAWLAEAAGLVAMVHGMDHPHVSACYTCRATIALAHGNVRGARRLALHSDVWKALDFDGAPTPSLRPAAPASKFSAVRQMYFEDGAVQLLRTTAADMVLSATDVALSGLPTRLANLKDGFPGVGRLRSPITIWFRGVKRSAYTPIETSPYSGVHRKPRATAIECELGPFASTAHPTESVTIYCSIPPDDHTWYAWTTEAADVDLCIPAGEPFDVLPRGKPDPIENTA